MVQITREEMWAWNELNGGIQITQEELQRKVGARDAYLALLETKYSAKFDPQSGQFIPIDGHKEVEAEEVKGEKVDA